MWEEILKLAVGSGLWAVLSLALLVYLLKDSKRREAKYMNIINTLGEELKDIKDIKKDVKEVLCILQDKPITATNKRVSARQKQIKEQT